MSASDPAKAKATMAAASAPPLPSTPSTSVAPLQYESAKPHQVVSGSTSLALLILLASEDHRAARPTLAI